MAFFMTLIGIEIYFRCFTGTLPAALGNYLGGGYHDKLFGIYRYDPKMRMDLMRPNYARAMFFNGLRWHHKTDARGFRNPVDRDRADVVLLGDSMIYGHGVEETSTVRHYLELMTKRSVENLGIQGGYIHKEYQIYKNFGVALRPKYVFLFFLFNDVQDVISDWIRVEKEDVSRFLSIPATDQQKSYFDFKMRKKTWMDKVKYYLGEIYVFKALGFFTEYMRKNVFAKRIANKGGIPGTGEPAARDASSVERDSWQSFPLFQERPELIPAMRFHLHGLLKMKDLAQKSGSKFVNVFIYTGNKKEEPTYELVLREFCRKQGICFFSLKDGFAAALKNGERLFLPGDGHFSDRGARLAARLIAEKYFKSLPAADGC